MTPKALADFGGEKRDAEVTENVTTELGADDYNDLAECTAQMTRTIDHFKVSFLTINAAAPQTGAVVGNTTIFGSGASTYPTISKTGLGVYTLAWASTYTNGLNVAESVGHLFPHGQAAGATHYPVQVEVTSATTLTVRVFTSAGSATDGGGGVLIKVWSQ